MKSCRKKKPFIVEQMIADDFYGTSKLEKIIVNRKKTHKIQKLTGLNDPMKLFIKTDFDGYFNQINLERKPAKGRQKAQISFNNLLTKMWVNGKEIAAPKLRFKICSTPRTK